MHEKTDRNVYAPQGFWIEDCSAQVRLPAYPGAPLEILTRRVLRAERSLTEWRQFVRRVGYGALRFDRELYGDGKLSTTVAGALMLPNATRPGESVEMVVDFGRTLRPGDRVEFSILERSTPEWDQVVRSDMRDRYAFMPEQTMARVEIRVVFPVARQPESVWYFTDAHDWRGYGEPTRDRVLALTRGRQATQRWRAPSVGLVTGLAWRW